MVPLWHIVQISTTTTEEEARAPQQLPLKVRVEFQEAGEMMDHCIHTFTANGEMVVLGGTNGSVHVRNLFNLDVMYRFEAPTIVRSLALVSDQFIFVGLENGKSHIFPLG